MEWDDYMSSKIRKLENQFGNDVNNLTKNEGLTSTIFRNNAIFVNGYTVPPAHELKKLMLSHGGTFHHYYSKGNTTHIIASNLSAATRRCLTTEKVVRPEWITDSIIQGKLLPDEPYSLMKCQNPNQLRLPTILDVNTSAERLVSNDATVLQQVFESYDYTADSRPIHNVPSCNVQALPGNILPSREAMHSSKNASLSYVASAKNATDSNFISEFYGHSRLHLISTMGAEFKDYVNKLQEKSSLSFPGRERIKKKFLEEKCININEFKQDNASKTLSNVNDSVLMHIDMDCFFVSVGLRNHSHLKGKPVAVAHSKGIGSGNISNAELYKMERSYYHADSSSLSTSSFDLCQDTFNSVNAQRKDISHNEKHDSFISTSEIASCNYEARAAGLRNGMFVGDALKLCPNLQLIPYDFEGYRVVAKILYDVIASYTSVIEAVSCDELFADCTEIIESFNCDPLFVASVIREEIAEKTKCTCSAGLGPNLLLARLATKKAKPNGQYFVSSELAETFISAFLVKDLPGVGRSVSSRLNSMGADTCAELQKLSLRVLQSEFGPKIGQQLFNFCRGIDDRQLKTQHLRKSVSADVNYGIRFTEQSEVSTFIIKLAEEVASRLNKIGMKGRNISLKLMLRKKDAPMETAKFLGHGICDSTVRSTSVLSATNDSSVIAKLVEMLLRTMTVAPSDIRGMGIQINRLEQASVSKESENFLVNFMKKGKSSSSTTTSATDVTSSLITFSEPTVEKTHLSNDGYNLPPLSQLDPTVMDALPDDIRNQIELEYKNIGLQNSDAATAVFNKPNITGPMDYLLSASCSKKTEIDQEVLQALPKEIQEEIRSLYNFESVSFANPISRNSPAKAGSPKGKHKFSPKKRGPLNKKGINIANKCHTVTCESTEDKIINSEDTLPKTEPTKEKAMLGTANHSDDVKLLLKEWITTCDDPEDNDARTVSHYLKALILEKKLEKVYNLVKCLKRLISVHAQNKFSWLQCCQQIIDDVQDLTINIYGAPLKLGK